jgi:hypothetical protein
MPARMPHVLELASTGRATCRGCGQKILKDTVRLGERVPNPFSDDGGETTHWYHPRCAAFRRPEALLAAIAATDLAIDDRALLEHEASLGVAHHRLPRVNTASLAPTGRATCRACKAPIDKDTWRIALVFYEDGRFSPSGYVHAGCAASYLETVDILPRVRHFSPDLTEADIAALATALATT